MLYADVVRAQFDALAEAAASASRRLWQVADIFLDDLKVMDIKLIATVFGIVFLAELGDKTQLATMLFAARSPGHLWAVFLGASLALVLASALGVLAGGFVARYLSPALLSVVAGVGFVVIGVWTIWQGATAG